VLVPISNHFFPILLREVKAVMLEKILYKSTNQPLCQSVATSVTTL